MVEDILTEVEGEPPKKPAPKSTRKKMIPASMISKQGQGMLVEWVEDGKPKRGIIPLDEYNFVKRTVAKDTLAAAIPYGVPWEDLEVPEITAEDFANSLRRAGIWSVDDLRTNPNRAVAALQAAYRISLPALMEFANNLEDNIQ